jgi:hypothetical protein
MRRIVRDLWINALRSDEYSQGQGCLTKLIEGEKDNDCCLGVLCKLALKNGVPLKIRKGNSGVIFYDGEDLILPLRVVKWAGLDSSNPLSAAHLNDDCGFSFSEISDRIEKFISVEEDE